MESFGVAVLILVVGYVLSVSVGRETVFEFERALRFDRGRFKGIVEPGLYWYFPAITRFVKIDARSRYDMIPGQEVLTADGVTVKISVMVSYAVSDPVTAINSSADFASALYVEMQIALRKAVGNMNTDEVLSGRERVAEALRAHGEKIAAGLGLSFMTAEVRDMMFPGKLKETFSQVAAAKKEAAAALERARGESASLRSLANAARMIEGNPCLLQLRLIQTLSAGSGNTVIFGSSGGNGAETATSILSLTPGAGSKPHPRKGSRGGGSKVPSGPGEGAE